MEDDIEIDIETNEEGTEVALIMTSVTGERISHQDYILTLEMYLSDLAEAHNQRVKTRAVIQ